MKATASSTMKKYNFLQSLLYICAANDLCDFSQKEKGEQQENYIFLCTVTSVTFNHLLSPFRNKNFPSASLSLKKRKFQSGSLRLQKALGSLDLFGVGIVVQCGSQKHVFC